MRESVENSQLQIISFEDCKYLYLIHTWSDKPFKGTDVYQTLPSLHRGSFEITLTVPLKVLFAKNERRYRHTAKNNCFWSLLFIFLSVAPIKRKLLKTTYTVERSVYTIQKVAIYDWDRKIINLIANKSFRYYNPYSSIIFRRIRI